MMRCIVLSSSLWKTKAVNLGGSGAKPPIYLTLAVPETAVLATHHGDPRSTYAVCCRTICVSSNSQVLNYSSPLYGRRTSQIRLRPVKFADIHEFFPGQTSQKELIWRYGVTGGIPRYIEAFRSNLPNENGLWAGVRANILDHNSLLYAEPFFLLGGEVKELGSYFSVLRTIAFGNHKLGHIAKSLQIKEANLRHFLKTLIDLDVLMRLVPVTEDAPEKSNLSLYVIADPFLRFWFRFVYPNRSRLEMAESSEILEEIKSHYVEGHLGYVFEQICLEDLIRTAPSVCPAAGLNRFGKWWNRREEIDLVALGEQSQSILFGECKLTRKPVELQTLHNLRSKAREVKWGHVEARQEYFILYSLSGFSPELQKAAARDDRITLKTLDAP